MAKVIEHFRYECPRCLVPGYFWDLAVSTDSLMVRGHCPKCKKLTSWKFVDWPALLKEHECELLTDAIAAQNEDVVTFKAKWRLNSDALSDDQRSPINKVMERVMETVTNVEERKLLAITAIENLLSTLGHARLSKWQKKCLFDATLYLKSGMYRLAHSSTIAAQEADRCFLVCEEELEHVTVVWLRDSIKALKDEPLRKAQAG